MDSLQFTDNQGAAQSYPGANPGPVFPPTNPGSSPAGPVPVAPGFPNPAPVQAAAAAGNWQCPSCGELNSTQNVFCKKCGYNPQAQAGGEKKSRLWLVVISLVALILLVVGGFLGYKQWVKKQEEKAAKNFIQEQQKFFSDSVQSINGISSETSLRDKYSGEENRTLVAEKMKAEADRAAEAADQVSKIKGSSDQLKGNQLVVGLNALIGSYFVDAVKMTEKYKGYSVFLYDDSRINEQLDQKNKAFKDKFKYQPQTMAEFRAFFVATKELLESQAALYDALSVPAGLEGYKKPTEETKKMIGLVGEFIDAWDKKDLARLDKLTDEMNSSKNRFMESVKQANELAKDYFSQMHDEFSTLRSKADKIKSEFMLNGSKLGVQSLDFSIEGW